MKKYTLLCCIVFGSLYASSQDERIYNLPPALAQDRRNNPEAEASIRIVFGNQDALSHHAQEKKKAIDEDSKQEQIALWGTTGCWFCWRNKDSWLDRKLAKINKKNKERKQEVDEKIEFRKKQIAQVQHKSFNLYKNSLTIAHSEVSKCLIEPDFCDKIEADYERILREALETSINFCHKNGVPIEPEELAEVYKKNSILIQLTKDLEESASKWNAMLNSQKPLEEL